MSVLVDVRIVDVRIDFVVLCFVFVFCFARRAALRSIALFRRLK